MPGGRPREFDVQQAVERALDVFWEHGYEGASLAQLTEAMGINRPSLYLAFGNKENLFRLAIERYYAGDAAHTAAALDEPTVRDVIREYLHRNVDAITSPAHPRGCLVVQSALRCSPENTPIADSLADLRRQTTRRLRDRFEAGRRDGDTTCTLDPEALADYISTVSEGMSVQAASGADPERLHAVVDVALHAVTEPANRVF